MAGGSQGAKCHQRQSFNEIRRKMYMPFNIEYLPDSKLWGLIEANM